MVEHIIVSLSLALVKTHQLPVALVLLRVDVRRIVGQIHVIGFIWRNPEEPNRKRRIRIMKLIYVGKVSGEPLQNVRQQVMWNMNWHYQ